MKTSWLVPAFLLAAACAAEAPETPAPEAATSAPASPYAFQVNLTLTPRAVEKLKTTNEQVNIAAMYFGLPVSETAPGVDEHGVEVGLGRDDVVVAPVNAVVTAPGAGFDPTYIASIEGAPHVLVNVYSARKTHADNLLSCGIYEGPVAMAQQKPVDIQCDLIYGPDGEPLPPPT